jgi:hypothetical protein
MRAAGYPKQASQHSLPTNPEAGQDGVEVIAVDIEELSVVQWTHVVSWHAIRSAEEVAQYDNHKWPVVARLLRGRLFGGLKIRSQSHLRLPLARWHLIHPPSEVTWPFTSFRTPKGNSRAITVLSPSNDRSRLFSLRLHRRFQSE